MGEFINMTAFGTERADEVLAAIGAYVTGHGGRVMPDGDGGHWWRPPSAVSLDQPGQGCPAWW